MTFRNWTEDEIKCLRIMFERNVPRKIMAAKLDRKETAVNRMLSRMGVTKINHYTVKGHIVTFEQRRMAEDAGLSWDAVQTRIMRGMPVEQAISEPMKSDRSASDVDELTPEEIEMIIGRMKYMNMTEAKDNPFQPTVPMMKKMKQHGIHVDDIKAVKC